jgi:hypothetical protein
MAIAGMSSHLYCGAHAAYCCLKELLAGASSSSHATRYIAGTAATNDW